LDQTKHVTNLLVFEFAIPVIRVATASSASA